MEEREQGRGPTGPGTGESRRGPRDRVSDGIRQGIGVLSAFKDALEETIAEARERGDLSPERARQVARSAMARAQEAASDARERLDFVPRAEHEQLRDRVDELRVRLENLERRVAQDPAASSSRPGPPDV